MAKTENKASVQKRGAGKHELSFGGKWQYAKAAESTDHVTIEDRYGLFIGGAWVRPKSGKYFRTVNPATPLAGRAAAAARALASACSSCA